MKILGSMVEQYGILCHSWVLMDNHYHLILETPYANLSLGIRHLNGVYTQWFNRKHKRVGHLFQGRFKAIIVERETHLLELCRYVVLNPVRAGLVKRPGQWKWSSFRKTVGEEFYEPWLTVNWILAQFDKKRLQSQRAYRSFVEEGIKAAMSPWEQLKGQIYLGSEKFIKEVRARRKEEGDQEIPQVQRNPFLPKLERLLEIVSKAYGVSVAEMVKKTHRPGEARKVGILIARRVGGLGLREIGKYFGVEYTTISRHVGELERRLENDMVFQKKIGKIVSFENIKT